MKMVARQSAYRVEMAKAAEHVGFPKRFAAKLLVSSWVDLSEKDFLAEALKADQEKAKKLLVEIAGGCLENRMFAAGCWQTPPEALKKLASDSKDGVRCLVAENPCSPDDVLRILASDLNTDVLDRVVGNLNAGEKTLKKVLNCPICREDQRENFAIFSAIAQHPNATVAMRGELAGFKEGLIRGAVACNPMTESHILERLTEKNAFDVSRNPGAPIEILKKVFCAAMKELEKDKNPTMLYNLAKNPHASSGLLDQLAHIGDCGICKAVIENHTTSTATLNYIAENYRDREVISGVARHLNTSDETLIFIYNARDPEAALRSILLRKAMGR